jgi:hypothetical protein
LQTPEEYLHHQCHGGWENVIPLLGELDDYHLLRRCSDGIRCGSSCIIHKLDLLKELYRGEQELTMRVRLLSILLLRGLLSRLLQSLDRLQLSSRDYEVPREGLIVSVPGGLTSHLVNRKRELSLYQQRIIKTLPVFYLSPYGRKSGYGLLLGQPHWRTSGITAITAVSTSIAARQ